MTPSVPQITPPGLSQLPPIPALPSAVTLTVFSKSLTPTLPAIPGLPAIPHPPIFIGSFGIIGILAALATPRFPSIGPLFGKLLAMKSKAPATFSSNFSALGGIPSPSSLFASLTVGLPKLPSASIPVFPSVNVLIPIPPI